MKYSKSLAGLRFITAFIIAYALHYALLFMTGPDSGIIVNTIFNIAGNAYIYASDLFLFVSGYLVFMSQDKYISSGISVFEFMKKKIVKLYPMFLITVVICFALERVGFMINGVYPLHADGAELRYSWQALLASLCMVQCGIFVDGDAMSVNGPSWFLSIYLICSLIFILSLRIKSSRVRYILYTGLTALGLYLIFAGISFPLMYSCNGRGYFFYFGGLLVAKILSYLSDKTKTWLSIPVAVVNIILIIYSYDLNGGNKAPILLLWPTQVYLALFCPPVEKLLSIKPLQYLGKYDMAVFLCNLPILTAIAFIDQTFGLGLNYHSTVTVIAVAVIGLVVSILISDIISWASKR